MTQIVRTVALLVAAAVLAGVVEHSGVLVPSAQAKRKRKRYLKVRKFKPRHGRALVNLDGDVRIRFNKALDPASISEGSVFFGKLDGERQDWTFRLEKKGKQLVLSPADGLLPQTDYQIRVRPGVLSSKGFELKNEKFAFFFTERGVNRISLLQQEQFERVEGALLRGRAVHTATLMDDGTVLLAGGHEDYTTVGDTADLFLPVGERLTPVGQLSGPRAFHAAAQYPGGALLIGGFSGQDALSSTDRYTSGTFTAGPSLNERRDFVSAIELEDGRVLVVGGLDYNSIGGALFSDTAEILDPRTGTFRFTRGAPTQRRSGHSMTLLADGRVLILGGTPRHSNGIAPPSSEIFDPVTETFRPTKLQPGQARFQHTAVLLDNGWVLTADGGSPIVEVYDPLLERFFFGGGSSQVSRTSSTLSVLPDGMGLIVGGINANSNGENILLRTIDVYVPDAGYGRVIRSDVLLPEARAGHTATTFPDGRVLFAGGWGPIEPPSLRTADLFIPLELLSERTR